MQVQIIQGSAMQTIGKQTNEQSNKVANNQTKNTLLGRAGVMVADGRVEIGVLAQERLNKRIRMFQDGCNSLSSLQPSIVRWDIARQNCKVNIGDLLANKLHEVLGQLDRSVTTVIAPCCGCAAGWCRGVGGWVCPAADGFVACCFDFWFVQLIHMPTRDLTNI